MVPRALSGTVRCMARPARPAAEVAAVREAAGLLRAESRVRATEALAKEVAARVVAEMLADVDGVNTDPFVAALQRAQRSPFVTLATCPEINTLAEFVERRVQRLRVRAGRYLSPNEQLSERSSIAKDVCNLLAGRYLRHLRLELKGKPEA